MGQSLAEQRGQRSGPRKHGVDSNSACYAVGGVFGELGTVFVGGVPFAFARGGSWAAANTGGALIRYNADFAIGQLTKGGRATASELIDLAKSQGWKAVQSPKGPLKYVDANGVERLTIKRGSARTPGSESPHVEIRNAADQRVNPYGDPVTRKSAGNHTPILWDLS